MDDLSLTRAAAEIMGWTAVGPALDMPIDQYDFGGTQVYVDARGRYWRYGDAGPSRAGVWREWRPLVSMDGAMQLVEHLRTRTTGPRYWCKMRTLWMDGEAGSQYVAGFTEWGSTGVNSDSDHRALADSLERAIVEAAVKTQQKEKL